MAETHVSEIDMSISADQVQRSIRVVAGTMSQSDASLVALTAAITTLTGAVNQLTAIIALDNQTAPWNSSLVPCRTIAVNEIAPSPTAATDVQMQFGLNIASAQARKALLNTGTCWQDDSNADVKKLHTAVVLMTPPMCPHRLAQAYDLVLEVDGHIPPAGSKLIRHALLLVRETLVLSVCHQQQMTKAAFEFCLQCLFKRAIKGEARSQLFLAHKNVMRHGMNEAQFNIYVAKVHEPPLQPEEIKTLFSVYERCTHWHHLSQGWDVTEDKPPKKAGKRGPQRIVAANAEGAEAAEAAEDAEEMEAQSSATEWTDADGRHALV